MQASLKLYHNEYWLARCGSAVVFSIRQLVLTVVSPVLGIAVVSKVVWSAYRDHGLTRLPDEELVVSFHMGYQI